MRCVMWPAELVSRWSAKPGLTLYLPPKFDQFEGEDYSQRDESWASVLIMGRGLPLYNMVSVKRSSCM